MLIIDSYNSYIIAEFLEYIIVNKIKLFMFLSYVTHLLQSFDVDIF